MVTDPRLVHGLASVEGVVPALDAAVQLVETVPNGVAAESPVFARLQRLACTVETAVAAAEQIRNGTEETGDEG